MHVAKLRDEARERVLHMPPLSRSRIDRRMPCAYVGVTALTPTRRYAKHLEGGITSVPIVREFGVGLLEIPLSRPESLARYHRGRGPRGGG